MGLFQLVAQLPGLFFKKRCVLARRRQFQVEVYVQVGLRKSVGHRGGEVGISAGITDVDDVAFARRLYVQPFLQQFGQPVDELAFALGFFLPLLLDDRALIHLQQLDHALRNAVAVDDVDLRGHVAGRDHAGQHHTADRVGGLDVDHHGRVGAVLLGQH